MLWIFYIQQHTHKRRFMFHVGYFKCPGNVKHHLSQTESNIYFSIISCGVYLGLYPLYAGSLSYLLSHIIY